MKIAVCRPQYDALVYSWHVDSLVHTDWPDGAEVRFLSTMGQWTPNAMFLMVEEAMRWGADWIFGVASDIGWQPDAVKRLMSHDKEVVSGWANGRCDPVKLRIARDFVEDSGLFKLCTKPGTGLERMAAGGLEMVCYRRDVFETLTKPWFFGPDMFVPACCDGKPRMMTEDFYFAKQARAFGVQMWVDWDVPLVHATAGMYTSCGTMHSSVSPLKVNLFPRSFE